MTSPAPGRSARRPLVSAHELRAGDVITCGDAEATQPTFRVETAARGAWIIARPVRRAPSAGVHPWETVGHARAWRIPGHGVHVVTRHATA